MYSPCLHMACKVIVWMHMDKKRGVAYYSDSRLRGVARTRGCLTSLIPRPHSPQSSRTRPPPYVGVVHLFTITMCCLRWVALLALSLILIGGKIMDITGCMGFHLSESRVWLSCHWTQYSDTPLLRNNLDILILQT